MLKNKIIKIFVITIIVIINIIMVTALIISLKSNINIIKNNKPTNNYENIYYNEVKK